MLKDIFDDDRFSFTGSPFRGMQDLHGRFNLWDRHNKLNKTKDEEPKNKIVEPKKDTVSTTNPLKPTLRG